VHSSFYPEDMDHVKIEHRAWAGGSQFCQAWSLCRTTDCSCPTISGHTRHGGTGPRHPRSSLGSQQRVTRWAKKSG